MLNTDEIHFVSSNKKEQFKFKAHFGPYIVNTRETSKEVDELLKKMKFKLRFTGYYDPLGIISRLRVEQNTTPYAHTPRPKIQQFSNKEKCKENTLKRLKRKLQVKHLYKILFQKTRKPKE